MARKNKFGGRHGSIGSDRFIAAAARDAIATLGGCRITYNRVVGKSSKSHPKGTWVRRQSVPSNDTAGGALVILYGDPVAVEACVFFPANDNNDGK